MTNSRLCALRSDFTISSPQRAPDVHLQKHCGVCEEDDLYFGAKVDREVTMVFPNTNHANTVEIVAMSPDGLPPVPALWKPEGGEKSNLVDWIGGPQYLREEAAYLIDRSLGFYLIPVSYVSEAYGEQGAAIYYTADMLPPRNPFDYNQVWIEKAGVLDYITSQFDRGQKHNYKTHPDDINRPVLYDNGLCLPQDGRRRCKSPFSQLIYDKLLSIETIEALRRCLVDASMWLDVTNLVGMEAVTTARTIIQEIVLRGDCKEN